MNAGARLYEQGDSGSSLFLLLEGDVHVFSRDAQTQAGIDEQRARRAADGKDGWGLLVPPGPQVASLVEGACFGAAGLLDGGGSTAPRADTAVVASPSASLLVLDYGGVRALFALDEETRRRAAVLSRSVLFARWPAMQLARLAASASSATFCNGRYIVRAGARADALYFIESGVVIERVVVKAAKHGRVDLGIAAGGEPAPVGAQSAGSRGWAPRTGGAGGHVGGVAPGVPYAPLKAEDWPVEISMYAECDFVGERPLLFNGARARALHVVRTRHSLVAVTPAVHTHATDLITRGDVTALVFPRDALAHALCDGASAAGAETLQRLRGIAEAREEGKRRCRRRR